jgi:hypothetical protein
VDTGNWCNWCCVELLRADDSMLSGVLSGAERADDSMFWGIKWRARADYSTFCVLSGAPQAAYQGYRALRSASCDNRCYG